MKTIDKTRRDYKRTYSDGNQCVFCNDEEIKNQECQGFSAKHWKLIVNKYPYIDGNVMLVPSRHVEALSELTDEEWMEFGLMLVKVKKVLGKVFDTTSFNIGANIGQESGASVSHIHWHILPRKSKNQGFVNILADIQIISTTPEEVKELIEKEIK